MSNAAHPSLLRRLMGLTQKTTPEVDPADMGTAIGLDYCLDEVPLDTAATTQQGRGTAPPHWLDRSAGAS